MAWQKVGPINSRNLLSMPFLTWRRPRTSMWSCNLTRKYIFFVGQQTSVILYLSGLSRFSTANLTKFMILTPWFWKDLLWSRFFRGTSLKAWKYLRTFGSTLNRSRKSCWPTTFMFLRKTECHVAVMTHFWGWGWHFHDFSIFTILWIGGCILHPQKQIMRKIQKIMTRT